MSSGVTGRMEGEAAEVGFHKPTDASPAGSDRLADNVETVGV